MDDLTEVRIFQHSTILYWWPVWLLGLLLGVTELDIGIFNSAVSDGVPESYENSSSGILFTGLILLTIFVTSVRMRGKVSITFVLGVIFILLSLARFGVLNDIVRAIPDMSVKMSPGFYFLLSGGLLFFWVLGIFLFDRVVYWRLSQSGLTQVKLFGPSSTSYDIGDMVVEYEAGDLLRHMLFGFGSGDITLRLSDGDSTIIRISNVLNISGKKQKIAHLMQKHSEFRGSDTTKPGNSSDRSCLE